MISLSNPSSLYRRAVALALGMLAQAALAAPVFQINTDGSGLAGATSIASLNVTGVGFVQTSPDANAPYLFRFSESGAYRALNEAGTGAFGSRDLTITYTTSGTGSFLDPGALTFDAGIINVYSDAAFDFGTATANYGANNGTLIATFDIFGGGPGAGGLVKVIARARAGSMLDGYFFDADGRDMSTAANTEMTLSVFNQMVNPDQMMISEVICGLADYKGPGCDGTPFFNSQLAFAVQDGGSASLSTVPEPPPLTLLGLSLATLALMRPRRRT
ncbi:flocculation-associated PEP-CTERM protein PepA [Azoarcus sp. L1K30]|uniref:flocculation-associated PEP-CTERM protein PepA n=1 Tax=Azoarcus sp. L1K30 TaxID=2820277 RepID=UPI001B840FFF|nr:flocculation-associated PEP-CTERM protein PepA [Azoarcus sp. L1K30]MBR0567908.1 flocculation-associated PEP-CTERM protein PepA [Azoarcus sp. L1K30]